VTSVCNAASPLVIAHRGASGSAPENTLAAYALAVEFGADMIEIDLHRTCDGAIVIMHDSDLAAVRGRGEISDASLATLRALDAGGGERIPTLDEVLDGFGARIPFNLELKRGTHGDYPGLEAAALAAVRGRGLLDRTIFSSFYDGVLERIRAGERAARIGVLVSRRAPQRWLERARHFEAEAVHFPVSLVTEEALDRAHTAGFAVYVYTVDDVEAMRRLIGWGADGLFTNHPERMRVLLQSNPPRP
jgi:glycerophosphoryl diester phosphodiesterase